MLYFFSRFITSSQKTTLWRILPFYLLLCAPSNLSASVFLNWLFLFGNYVLFWYSSTLQLFSYVTNIQSLSMNSILIFVFQCIYIAFHLPLSFKDFVKICARIVLLHTFRYFPAHLYLIFLVLYAPCPLHFRFLVSLSILSLLRCSSQPFCFSSTFPLFYLFPTCNHDRLHTSRFSTILFPSTGARIQLNIDIRYVAAVLFPTTSGFHRAASTFCTKIEEWKIFLMFALWSAWYRLHLL